MGDSAVDELDYPAWMSSPYWRLLAQNTVTNDPLGARFVRTGTKILQSHLEEGISRLLRKPHQFQTATQMFSGIGGKRLAQKYAEFQTGTQICCDASVRPYSSYIRNAPNMRGDNCEVPSVHWYFLIEPSLATPPAALGSWLAWLGAAAARCPVGGFAWPRAHSGPAPLAQR